VSTVAVARPKRGLAALLGLVAGVAGCASSAPDRPPAWVAQLAAAPPPPPGRAWPLPPDRLERLLGEAGREDRRIVRAGSGVTGAYRLTAYFPGAGRELDLKWKVAPRHDADGWNNAPRKELAAYEIQKWFLDPPDYVVPTTRARCRPLRAYRELVPEAQPNLPGAQCVFGVDAVWLERVKPASPLYEEDRFRSERGYAEPLANFNLLAYLIEHRDARMDNILVAEDAASRRVYSVDNGIAFGSRLHNFFLASWEELRVPALPRRALDRLCRTSRSRAGELAVVAQLERDPAGVLRAAPQGPPIDPRAGVTFRDDVLQLGLKEEEIDDVWSRLQDLCGARARGALRVF
jgi:hypothetical protein